MGTATRQVDPCQMSPSSFYQLVAIASSHDGTKVASACRASNPEHAVIRVHSTSTWDPIGAPLAGHSLTITRIAFSHDDQRILSVSRDRGWRVFKKDEQGEGYVLEAKDERAHSRMVLDAAWGEGFFATASRDKTVCASCRSIRRIALISRSKSGCQKPRHGLQSPKSS